MPNATEIRIATWGSAREMGRASLLIPLSAKLTRAIQKELNSDEKIEFQKGVREAAAFLNATETPMRFTGDKTDATALVQYAQSLEAEIGQLRKALADLVELHADDHPPGDPRYYELTVFDRVEAARKILSE